MRLPRIIGHRLRSLLRRSQVESDLRSEIDLHIEQLTKEYMSDGMSEAEARMAARREFGSVDSAKEDCRDMRRVNWIEDFVNDLGYAFRVLKKSPGFTLTAVLSLALGIGANTAIFSLVQKVILELLPIRDPESLVRVSRRNIMQADSTSFSYPLFRHLQKSNDLPFDGFLATSSLGRVTMLTDAGAEPVAAEMISGNYFELLGVRPGLGRLLTVEDDRVPGAHPVAVLSHNFWKRRFGQDPSVLNMTVRLNNLPFTIVGVSARDFGGLDPAFAPDVRVPLNMESALGYSPAGASALDRVGSSWLVVFGRLKRGVSYDEAGNALLPVLLRNYPFTSSFTATDYGRRLRDSERMQVFHGAQGNAGLRRRFETGLWVLTAIVASVLMLATVNIAQLLLARASTRAREMSVRAAIGAGRSRLIRQLLTESLLLAGIGGLLGLVVARITGQMLIASVVSDRLHSTLALTPTPVVLAFNFGVALLAGLLFGLMPAIHASRLDLVPGLKGTHSGRGGRHIGRKLLISFQAALSIALLVGAGLFLRTMQRLHGLDLGFQPENVIQFGLDPVGYAPEQVHAFYDRVRERIAALPGVRGVAVSRQRLVGGGRWGSGISVPGYAPREGEPDPYRDAVSSGYFRALGIPLVAGREFSDSDLATKAKVAIVNEAFAKAYFGNENPLGKGIGEGGQPADRTIVGVAKNAKYVGLRDNTMRFWYVPHTVMNPQQFHAFTISVRTAGEPDSMLNAIRSEIAAIDKSLAMFGPRTIKEQIGDNLMLERLLATLSVFFGVLAAALAAIGLFGVLSWSVSQREREIGIRMALGARPAEVAWTVVRDVVLFTSMGLVAGVGIALALSGLVEKLLFDVKPNDGIAIAAACGVMLIVAAIAAFLPARRAAGIDPAVAFRTEQ